ncbi:hypothetical protein ATCVMN08101_139L [Acanthocystis turfacea Chlorella virus MN0810.1]|nr:hypothetical protein ATCVMN08101_139L [Acanthocystis turfacea Chlorella virus MN0810.1]
MSRIAPAMSDGRAFTNYVSSGLYNNYLESVFKTPDDTDYRAFLQKNARDVEKKVGQLTAFYVKPPVLKQSKLKVVGDDNPSVVSAPVGYQQNIMSKQYNRQLAEFNTVAGQQRRFAEYLDYNNVSPYPQ